MESGAIGDVAMRRAREDAWAVAKELGLKQAGEVLFYLHAGRIPLAGVGGTVAQAQGATLFP